MNGSVLSVPNYSSLYGETAWEIQSQVYDSTYMALLIE